MDLIFDIEGNGLLKDVTKIWMVCAEDMNTGQKYDFCDYDSSCYPLKAYRELMSEAKAVTGHFILGYDLPALEKVDGFVLPKHVKIRDTLLMSQTLDYRRFGHDGHSLDRWGEYLGIPKPVHQVWTEYSPEMLHRCREDRRINLDMYKLLVGEFKAHYQKKPAIAQSLRNEHKCLEFVTRAEILGWPFDVPAATALSEEIAQKITDTAEIVEPLLPPLVRLEDKEVKHPKWTAKGSYHSHIAKYFDIEPEDGQREFPTVVGPYMKIKITKPDMGSIESVKALLTSIGWEPDDWTWRKEGRAMVKVSAKLSTSSLLPLGPVGEAVDRFYTLRSRAAMVNGWLKEVDENGRIHGSCFLIGTPTGRATHKGIVNVPGGEAIYGTEIRKLFIARPGHKVIGADSSGNQMRAFCHYLRNEEYTNEVINGDVHTKNMQVLQLIVAETTRKKAKPFLYAFLFGGGADKLALILTGRRDTKIGKRAKEVFIEKTPGLKILIDKVTRAFDASSEASGDGYGVIPCIDGRKVYVDLRHKALNFLLQSCEAVTCKAAVAMLMDELDKEGIPWEPRIFYHDEVEFEVPDEYAERAAVIAKMCFKEAPKQFGVMIMDGEAKIGDNWYDVH